MTMTSIEYDKIVRAVQLILTGSMRGCQEVRGGLPRGAWMFLPTRTVLCTRRRSLEEVFQEWAAGSINDPIGPDPLGRPDGRRRRHPRSRTTGSTSTHWSASMTYGRSPTRPPPTRAGSPELGTEVPEEMAVSEWLPRQTGLEWLGQKVPGLRGPSFPASTVAGTGGRARCACKRGFWGLSPLTTEWPPAVGPAERPPPVRARAGEPGLASGARSPAKSCSRNWRPERRPTPFGRRFRWQSSRCQPWSGDATQRADRAASGRKTDLASRSTWWSTRSSRRRSINAARPRARRAPHARPEPAGRS